MTANPLIQPLRRSLRARMLWAQARGRAGSAKLWYRMVRDLSVENDQDIASFAVVDIGAHHGYYSFLAAHAMANRRGLQVSRIYAFEPQARVFDNLCWEIDHTFPKWAKPWLRPVCAAVGDRYAAREVYNKAGHTASASLYPGAGLAATGEKWQILPLGHFLTKEPLAIVRAIKIDVEGHELSVLNGGVDALIEESEPNILVEMNTERLAAAGESAKNLAVWFWVRDYSLYAVDERHGLESEELNMRYIRQFQDGHGMMNVLAVPRHVKVARWANL